MKPTRFHYHAPATLAEAVGLLADHGEDAKVLAGGQSLVPMLSLRLASFGHLIDLNRISGVSDVARSNGHLRIGAMTRQAVAEHSAEVAAHAPLVARALPHIGHFQIRNRGTVGGSIAHADPASELPSVALALDAVLEATGPSGTRRLAAKDFFVSTWETALADGEILSAIEFPVWDGRCGWAVEEISRRHGDFALVGTTVGVQVTDGAVTRAGIALFGVAGTPVRAQAAEAALLAGADAAEAGRVAADELRPSDDIHASGSYRKQVAAVVVRRAIVKAMQEAAS
jgi:aerobic carbon-monoxide dehydrogenase medium subunit